MTAAGHDAGARGSAAARRALPRSFLAAAFAIGLATCATSVSGAPACGSARCAGFDWQSLGNGIYAAIRREPPGLLEHANSLVIVNSSDVVVVDSQMTPRATREVIRAIRAVTSKPVRYVINTHWHDDHVFGNAAYAVAYPGVEFVSSAATRADLETVGRDNRREFVAALPGELRLMSHHLDARTALDWKDLGRDARPLDASTRRSLRSSIAQARSYLSVEPGTGVKLAGLTVDSELVLHRGSREIHVLCVGVAHTRGDVVVWLPREGVLATGDVVSGIVPMASGTADLTSWSSALDRLVGLAPRVLVPGHGAVASGDDLILRTSRLLGAVLERTTAVYRPGAALADVEAGVHLEDFRRSWSADDPMRELLFVLFFEQPAIASTYRRLSTPAS